MKKYIYIYIYTSFEIKFANSSNIFEVIIFIKKIKNSSRNNFRNEKLEKEKKRKKKKTSCRVPMSFSSSPGRPFLFYGQ